MEPAKKYEAIVIGTSAGGLYALSSILGGLPAEYPLPIIVVQHRSKDKKDLLELLIKVDKYIATNNQLKFIKRFIYCKIVRRKNNILLQRLIK